MTHVKEWTDQQLNRALAELMGYTMYEYNKDIEENCYFELTDPTGQPEVPFDGERKTEAEAWEDAPHYCTDPAASLEVEKAAIAVDNAGYVRNLSIVKWRDAVDPEEVAEWTSIDIQGVGDLFTASPRERAEAAYITLTLALKSQGADRIDI